MIPVVQMLLCIAIGIVIALITGVRDFQNAWWYMFTISCLLAVGLYASTFGIAIAEARRHLKLIVTAVTVGVFLKALFIGGTLAFLFHDPYFLLVGVAVAQIDPLSVAALMKADRLSPRAKTILGAWASFDDPVTVILALYTPVLVAILTHNRWGVVTNSAQAHSGAAGYLGDLGLNMLFAVSVLALWLLLGRLRKKYQLLPATFTTTGAYVFVSAMLAIGAYYFWMLGVAIVGLFARPPIEKIVEKAVRWALWLAALLLGFLLINGVSIGRGLLLGVVAYASQIVVGWLLTRGLPQRDRIHIALAQQNGITAIILSLLFEPIFPGTVAIVAPAIVTINVLHHVVNGWADKRLRVTAHRMRASF